MNILFISSSSSNSGGGELYILKLASGLISRGHRVSVAYSNSAKFNPISHKAIETGCEVIRFNYQRIYDLKLRSFQLLLKPPTISISQQVLDSFDIIHIVQQNIEDGINLVSAVPRQVAHKVIITIHIVENLKKLGQKFAYIREIYPSITYAKYKKLHRFIFLTNVAKEKFGEVFKFTPAKSTIIYNGASIKTISDFEIKSLLNKIKVSESSFVVGSVGRLEEQKNYSLLLEAFDLFLRDHPDSYLVLVGDGSLRDYLIEEATSLNIRKNVYITGWLESPEIFYNIFNIFVLPSWFEGFPFSLIEAMVNNCFCLASKIPPHIEAVQGEEAMLFNPNNVRELANKISNFRQKPALYEPARQKLVRYAQANYTYEKMLDKTLAFYQS